VALTAALLAGTPLIAQTGAQPAEDPIHSELRAVRDAAVDAFNKRDIDRLLSSMHPDVVITWQNAEVSRKHDGVRKYYRRMLLDPNSVVESLTIDLQVDELAIIHGRNATIAWGTLGDKYKLRDGSEFTMNSRWSATLVKEADRWLVASAHGSVNAFDNEILRLVVKRAIIYSGTAALVVGLVLGGGGIWLLKRRAPATVAPH
jgi:ketosteroid isomerase-like protein